MGRVDYFMSGDCPGTYQIYEGRREELEGDGEGMPGLNQKSETGDKGGVRSQARACFHQLNCNHTV